MEYRCFLFIICCLLFSRCSNDPVESGISGTIVNERNEPVANVQIKYWVEGSSKSLLGPANIIKDASIRTDSTGRFEIVELLRKREIISYVVQIPDLNLPYTAWKDNLGGDQPRNGILRNEYLSDVIIVLLLL